jgi:DNA-binding helix-hairpin-helix protein with protein kinase domain
MQRFLERHRLEDASIPRIGHGLKDVLASYGIEDAYDVDEFRLLGVPGFGPDRTARLLAWRDSIQRRFNFNAREPTDPKDITMVEQEISGRKS